MLHDSRDDVTEARHPTASELEVIGLLELNPSGHPTVRLSLSDWRHVDQVAARLTAARAGAVVPAPRTPSDPLPAGAQ